MTGPGYTPLGGTLPVSVKNFRKMMSEAKARKMGMVRACLQRHLAAGHRVRRKRMVKRCVNTEMRSYQRKMVRKRRSF